MKRLYRLLGVA
jgi:hypothetical protein